MNRGSSLVQDFQELQRTCHLQLEKLAFINAKLNSKGAQENPLHECLLSRDAPSLPLSEARQPGSSTDAQLQHDTPDTFLLARGLDNTSEKTTMLTEGIADLESKFNVDNKMKIETKAQLEKATVKRHAENMDFKVSKTDAENMDYTVSTADDVGADALLTTVQSSSSDSPAGQQKGWRVVIGNAWQWLLEFGSSFEPQVLREHVQASKVVVGKACHLLFSQHKKLSLFFVVAIAASETRDAWRVANRTVICDESGAGATSLDDGLTTAVMNGLLGTNWYLNHAIDTTQWWAERMGIHSVPGPPLLHFDVSSESLWKFWKWSSRTTVWHLVLTAKLLMLLLIVKVVQKGMPYVQSRLRKVWCPKMKKRLDVWPSTTEKSLLFWFVWYHVLHFAFLYLLISACMANGLKVGSGSGLPWEAWNDWLNWMGLVTISTAVVKYARNDIDLADSSAEIFMQFVPGLGSDISLAKAFTFIGLNCQVAVCGTKGMGGPLANFLFARSLAWAAVFALFVPVISVYFEDDIHIAVSYITSHWPVIFASIPITTNEGWYIKVIAKLISQATLAKWWVSLLQELLQAVLEIWYGVYFEFSAFIYVALMMSLAKIFGIPIAKRRLESEIAKGLSKTLLLTYVKENGNVKVAGEYPIELCLKYENLHDALPELLSLRAHLVPGREVSVFAAVLNVFSERSVFANFLDSTSAVLVGCIRSDLEWRDKVRQAALANSSPEQIIEHVEAYLVADGTDAPILDEATFDVTALDFSNDGKLLATGAKDKKVRLYTKGVDGQFQLSQSLDEATDHVNAVALANDGKLLATGSRDNKVRLYTKGVDAEFQLSQSLDEATFDVNAVALANDGKLLATGAKDTKVRLYTKGVDAEFQLSQSLDEATDYVTAVALANDGKLLATGSWDKKVRLYTKGVDAEFQLSQSLDEATYRVEAVALANDGKLLATGSIDKKVRLYTKGVYAQFQLSQSLDEGTNFLNAVAFANDGKLLATGSWGLSGDSKVRLYGKWCRQCHSTSFA